MQIRVWTKLEQNWICRWIFRVCMSFFRNNSPGSIGTNWILFDSNWYKETTIFFHSHGKYNKLTSTIFRPTPKNLFPQGSKETKQNTKTTILRLISGRNEITLRLCTRGSFGRYWFSAGSGLQQIKCVHMWTYTLFYIHCVYRHIRIYAVLYTLHV